MSTLPNPEVSSGDVVDYGNADARLHQLDPALSVDLLRDAVVTAFREYASKVNSFFPINARGTVMYQYTTAYLREQLYTEHGWGIDDTKNVACAVSRSGNLRIACLAGGPGTGDMTSSPSPRKRGKGTIDVYGQVQLPGLESNKDASDKKFWYLLTYINDYGSAIHAELSCPVIDSSGSITDWSERIELGPFEFEASANIEFPTSEPPVIDVRRKASSE